MLRFGDEDVLLAHDAPGLAQGQFDDAGIDAVAGGKLPGGGGWLHRVERHRAAFRLGHDLVFDHQDVAVVKPQTAEGQRVNDQVGNGIAARRRRECRAPEGRGVRRC